MLLTSIWKEDVKSNGNGTEATILIDSSMSVGRFLDQHGSVPIPPYLHRDAEESDSVAYNNCYAKTTGSVAAPTAGLHFTKALLQEIGSDRINYLSLHVGAGTFQPVVTASARDHAMHAETFSVSVGEIRHIVEAIQRGKPLVVVGTTSCRTMESLYWCGTKKLLFGGEQDDVLKLGQFDWLPLSVRANGTISTAAALGALVEGKSDTDALHGRTALMIAPPLYKFQTVDHLVTNFHAPDSTLMLLVSAFMGTDTIQRLYADAQKENYRFLSYGDVCLFSKPSHQ